MSRQFPCQYKTRATCFTKDIATKSHSVSMASVSPLDDPISFNQLCLNLRRNNTMSTVLEALTPNCRSWGMTRTNIDNDLAHAWKIAHRIFELDCMRKVVSQKSRSLAFLWVHDRITITVLPVVVVHSSAELKARSDASAMSSTRCL
jgi:hypothetical protein